jgi:hypothetical protein
MNQASTRVFGISHLLWPRASYRKSPRGGRSPSRLETCRGTASVTTLPPSISLSPLFFEVVGFELRAYTSSFLRWVFSR